MKKTKRPVILNTEYPWIAMHKGHVAFYAKNATPFGSQDVVLPSGEHPAYCSDRRCGTCDELIAHFNGVTMLLREK